MMSNPVAGWYRPTPESSWRRIGEAPTPALGLLLFDQCPAAFEKAITPAGGHPDSEPPTVHTKGA